MFSDVCLLGGCENGSDPWCVVGVYLGAGRARGGRGRVCCLVVVPRTRHTLPGPSHTGPAPHVSTGRTEGNQAMGGRLDVIGQDQDQ